MKTEQRSSGAPQLGQGDTVEPRRSSESTLSSLVAFCGISLILLAAMLLTSPATSAAQPGAPAVLPTRVDTPPPISRAKREPPPVGAWIELRMACQPSCAVLPWQEMWTVVQWQDGLGRWHDVEGWQGKMEVIGGDQATRSWWVDHKDFGAGPFRWLICQENCHNPLGASASFYLPDGLNRVVAVEVTAYLESDPSLPLKPGNPGY